MWGAPALFPPPRGRFPALATRAKWHRGSALPAVSGSAVGTTGGEPHKGRAPPAVSRLRVGIGIGVGVGDGFGQTRNEFDEQSLGEGRRQRLDQGEEWRHLLRQHG